MIAFFQHKFSAPSTCKNNLPVGTDSNSKLSKLERVAARALDVLLVCRDSNYGKDWLWPETAHKTAMNEVCEVIGELQKILNPEEMNQP